MEDLTAIVGATRARLLVALRGGPQTILAITSRLGITETAVRGHLGTLREKGYVAEAGYRRGGRGKPPVLYRLTEAGEDLFPKAYGEALRAVVAALRSESGPDDVSRVLGRAGRDLAPRAAHGSPEERLKEAAAAFNALGGALTVTRRPNGWSLEGTGCPLSAVSSHEPAICALACALLCEVSGMDLRIACERVAPIRCSFFTVEAA